MEAIEREKKRRDEQEQIKLQKEALRWDIISVPPPPPCHWAEGWEIGKLFWQYFSLLRVLKEAEKRDKLENAKREKEAKQQLYLEEKKRRQEERQEEKLKKLQELELKRQQTAMIKEQVKLSLPSVLEISNFATLQEM